MHPLGSAYIYGFGGKEYQEDNSIGLLDFGSRNYDPELGRWFNMDPKNQFGSSYLYAYNNPIRYIDPDGEFAITAMVIVGSVIGGAWLGAMTTALTGGSRSDIAKSALIGAIAGIISAGTASAVSASSAVATSGIANTITGAAAGGAGGFASGSLNAAFKGNSIGDIVGSGFKEGIIGGAIGGALGGIKDIVDNTNLNRTLNDSSSDIPLNQDGSLTPSNDLLEDYSNRYFSEFKFREEARLSYDNEFIKNLEGNKNIVNIRANTSTTRTNGKFDIRFGDKAFASQKILFRTMGHEFVHIAHLHLKLPINAMNYGSRSNYTEYGGYSYADYLDNGQFSFESRKNFVLPRGFRMTNSFINKLRPYVQYKSWNLPTIYPKF